MATAQLVVDTDVLIDHLRRGNTVMLKVLSSFRCALTVIAVYELHAVHTLSARQRAVLDQVLAQMEVLPLLAPGAERAAAAWRSLAGRGQTIGLPDTLSAGICLANDSPLLTRNVNHFRRIEGLKVFSPDDLQASFPNA